MQQREVKLEAVERRKHAYRIRIGRLAAAVLVLIISGVLWIHYGLPMLNEKNGILASLFGSRQDSVILPVVVPRGKDSSVSLPDGSTIHINSDSRMEVQFTKSSRKVEFKGEAYFNVSPDRRPFIITTSYTTIEVLGTAFNVNTYDSGVIRISLVKGKIRSKALNKEVIVQAGEELIYGPGGASKLELWTENPASAWQQGIYSIRNDNFKSVATTLERLFDTCVVIDDERLLHSSFTAAVYKSIGLMSNIDNIQKIIEFDSYFSGDTLHLTSK